jgi:beta-barrel assembly-enhancing protease
MKVHCGSISLVVLALVFSFIPALAQDAPASIPDHDKAHRGGLKDVSAIGNRNVGCGRGMGNWYSLERQIQMGKEFAQQVESSSRMVTDSLVTEYINRLGQNLVRNSDAQVAFTIKVIDADEVNAFALPGGFFYVDSGLILAADNEAELAGVMAHEIAHVAACHAARESTRGQLMNLASIPLIFVGGGIGYAIRNAAGLAVPLSFLKFSRGFESEADFLGLQYLYKAGYDPQAFTAFFEKVEAMNKVKPGTLAKAFSTHPQTPDRIAKTQKEIATVLPARDQYKVDTSEFQEVKAHLASVENRRQVDFARAQDRPTLRRGAHPNRAESGNSGDDEERPKLRRRNDSRQDQ